MAVYTGDHTIVRDGIKDLFDNETDNIRIVTNVGSYDELYWVLGDVPADILMLDGLIIGDEISEKLPVIRLLCPNLKILLFWITSNEENLTKWIHLLYGQISLIATKYENLSKIMTTTCK